jgi:Flp pilus assembly protein TadD
MTMKMNIQISPKDFAAAPASPARVAEARAGYLAASNRPVEARATIDQARQLGPDRPGSYEVEGLLFEHAQDMAGAEKAYSKAIELRSENFLPYVRLAYMQRAPGQDTAAKRRELFAKAVALNPDYPQAQQGLSSALVQLGEIEAALGPARRAVSLNPSDVFGRTTLAGVLGRAGKKDEALNEMRIAQSLARTDQEKQSVQQTLAMLDRIK